MAKLGKKNALVFSMVLACASRLHAGVVTFEPVDPWSIYAGPLPMDVAFNVFVKTTDPNFNDSVEAVSLVIGSDTLQIQSFTRSSDWDWRCAAFCQMPMPAAIYPSDLYVVGFAPGASAFDTSSGPGYLLGTLIVRIPSGVDIAPLTFGVDSGRDGGASSLGRGDLIEDVYGVGSIPIIPEPTTLGLLSLAILAAAPWGQRGCSGAP